MQGGSPQNGTGEDLLRQWALWCGAIAAAFGVLGMVNWFANRPLLSGFSSRYVPLSLDGSVGFILLGLALNLHLRCGARGFARACVFAFAMLAAFLGAVNLVRMLAHPGEFLTGFDRPAYFTDALWVYTSSRTAVGFIFAGASVIALTVSSSERP